MPLDFPTSPTNGQYYNGFVYNAANDTWDSAYAPRAATVPISSPNYAINGAFDIWQRGTSFTPTNGVIIYTADRFWVYRDTGSAVTVSRQTFTPGSAPDNSIEGTYFYRYAQTTTGSGGSLNLIAQPIENARILAGKTATISFWAKADAARTVTPQLSRAYGSGGSAEETIFTGSAITLSTSWARYSVTTTIPSVSGKTINDGSNLTVLLKLAANVVQTVDIWGLQLEEGAAATDFRRNAPSIQAELAACQRYYYRRYAGGYYGWFSDTLGNQAGTTIRGFLNLPVKMRTIPHTLDYGGAFQSEGEGSGRAITTMIFEPNINNADNAYLTFGHSGTNPTTGYYQVISNNNPSSYIGVSAEL